MSKPVIIIGAGGHAKVLAESLLRGDQTILGFTDPDASATLFEGIPYLGTDAIIFEHRPEEILLVNGLGSVGDNRTRQAMFSSFTAKAYRFTRVIHPSAIISHIEVEMGSGCQILAGALINPGARLGNNIIINSHAVVEHDCRIGDHVHISPGAIICGNCTIDDMAYIGASSTLKQGVNIGKGAIIAAGAVVINDVPSYTLMAGVPAQQKHQLQGGVK
ncbi:MAG: acetyltransferase [Ectothiorhodospiraceae bacterium]|nr:acetyltransferase [Ectothiorhodospiraceae bacterium]